MSEQIDENYVNRSVEELKTMFEELKQVFKQEIEEKECLKQKLDFFETNCEWSQTNVQRFKQQIFQYKTCIDCQQKSLLQMNQIKELNKELNAKITDLNVALKTNDDNNRMFVNKIRSEMNSVNEELNNSLKEKEKLISELNLTISSKDLHLNQLKRELMDKNTKNEENMEEIKEFYEKKIQSIYKEFDNKYQKNQKQNDEKIIEIRANCMRSVDKTKDDFETKLCKTEVENKELKEQLSHLKLEFEAMKMSNKFDNQKNNPKNTKTSSKQKPKLTIQLLDSDEELNEPNNASNNHSVPKSVTHSVSKRKKLIPNSDTYLEFVRNDLNII